MSPSILWEPKHIREIYQVDIKQFWAFLTTHNYYIWTNETYVANNLLREST